MDYPKSVYEIVTRAANKHKQNIESAVAMAVAGVKKLPEYSSIVDSLVYSAIQDLVYDSRHNANTSIKRQSGAYGGKSKIVVGQSVSIQEAYQSIYDIRIAGNILGYIVGKELAGLAEKERATGDGHYVNAKLVESLVAIVPENKRVRDAVTEKRLRVLLKQAQEKIQREAA